MPMHLIQCEFKGLCDSLRKPVTNMPISGVVHAVVRRLSDHPRLGEPNDSKYTITSQVRSIDFERGWIITQNNVYQFRR